MKRAVKREIERLGKGLAFVRWVPIRGPVVYYRAEVTGRWKPAYAGATPEVKLDSYVEGDGGWRPVRREDIPHAARERLRDRLRGGGSAAYVTVHERYRRSR